VLCDSDSTVRAGCEFKKERPLSRAEEGRLVERKALGFWEDEDPESVLTDVAVATPCSGEEGASVGTGVQSVELLRTGPGAQECLVETVVKELVFGWVR